ncbi:HD domain-containing phosphohydrolase [Magnetospira sp. QH-2]|uniref:HD domain-containing phosphohydrolase n=1 Tax=Magnetospira sp. (strain QH-2) TaxID=1288970 RepID=UPI0003E81200|nr:HD domain-containing phosphohydrolase [Magnetospira sp. QH-2]CCQ72426.1 Putative Sensory protein (PYP-type PAS domain:Metal-dependent phosphohydrolase, HD region) [Magnetospira sp. QH-2]
MMDAFRQSEQMPALWAAFDVIGDVVMILASDGTIRYANKAAQESLLIDSSELVGRQLWHFMAGAQGKSMRDNLPLAGDPREQIHGTGEWVSKYGTERTLHWKIRLLSAEDGSDSPLLFTGTDITDLDRARAEFQRSQEATNEALVQTVRALARTIESRDPYTAGHQSRVAELSLAIGREMGLAQDRLTGLEMGAMIHDIGKIHIPAEILTRPGRISSQEYELLKTHTSAGATILRDVPLPWPVMDMVRQHHERLDGSGYPLGMKEPDLLLESKIIAVADVAEAITGHRPYRAALGIETALKVLNEGRGSGFDDDVVGVCVMLFRQHDFEWTTAFAETAK